MGGEGVTSDELKYAVMRYWRFKRQAHYIATEVGGYTPNIKDVLLVCGKKVIEVECKISTSDFMADFKKRKHEFYERGFEFYNTPNYLYYAIPWDLAIDESMFEQHPKYGLLRVGQIEPYNNPFEVKFIRKAQNIEVNNTQEKRIADAQDVIFKRMASEIINIRRRMIKEPNHA